MPETTCARLALALRFCKPWKSQEICTFVGNENATPAQRGRKGLDARSPGRDAPSRGRDVRSRGRDAWSRGRDAWSRGRDDRSRGRDAWSRGRDEWSRGRDAWSRGRDAWSRGRDAWSRGRDTWSLRVRNGTSPKTAPRRYGGSRKPVGSPCPRLLAESLRHGIRRPTPALSDPTTWQQRLTKALHNVHARAMEEVRTARGRGGTAPGIDHARAVVLLANATLALCSPRCPVPRYGHPSMAYFRFLMFFGGHHGPSLGAELMTSSRTSTSSP